MTISIQDYTQWIQGINTTVTTAFSEFVHSMEHVGDQVRSGAITEAQAQNRVANFLYDQYRTYESSARDWRSAP